MLAANPTLVCDEYSISFDMLKTSVRLTFFVPRKPNPETPALKL
jgi:hypothetical protein